MRYSVLVVTTLLLFTLSWAVAQTLDNRSKPFTTRQSSIIESPPKQRVEIGLVRWGRDFETAQAESEKTGKPILVLFQEVPGCAGCQKFGREVLSQPLIVDAIQHEFVPVLVYNNRSTGKDAALLKRFNEPAWNYQVLRFLDSKAKDIIPRRDQVWTVAAVAERIADALENAKRPVPKYLQSLLASSTRGNQQLAAFAMHCYWTGEHELGRIDGVTATEAGWIDGREVTLVRYDSSQLTLKSLAAQAAKVRCADKMYTPDGRNAGRRHVGKLSESYRTAASHDQKRHLRQWPKLFSMPAINTTQLTKLNALLPKNRDAAFEWLSPSQRVWLNGIKHEQSRNGVRRTRNSG